jgi:release factor glutamine methyltransferase
LLISSLIARDALGISQALGLSMGDARSEVQILLAHALGRSRTWLLIHSDDSVEDRDLEAYARSIDRRLNGEPIAYIVRRREFFGIDFEVNEYVLIPRPETELLVQTALDLLPNDRPVRVLDLGTGSGCIAIAIATSAPRWAVLGVEVSPEALSVAVCNLQRHGLENLDLLCSHWYEALNGMVFDIIVSNPPYVASDDAHLVRGDLRFEPVQALTPGPIGLEAIEHIVGGSARYLAKDGWLVLEHGYDQADAVQAYFRCAGFVNVATKTDLANLPRVSFGRISS